MTTLKNHLIFYDADCPMCSLYTKAFVHTGLLEHTGRAAYQQLQDNICPMVDRQRAVNEIALVNQETGEVSYGIQSLFKLFGTLMPVLKPLFTFKPFVWFMAKVYSFISYNRRVIIPAGAEADTFRFQPTFRLNYRIAYVFFTWVVTSLILTGYNRLLTGMVPAGGAYREFMICGGQIFFQATAISLIARIRKWDYLGNMMTISFAGALMLLPVLALHTLIGHHPVFYTIYFILIAGLMLLEHLRRTRLLKLSPALTISWALYRVLVLLVILIK